MVVMTLLQDDIDLYHTGRVRRSASASGAPPRWSVPRCERLSAGEDDMTSSAFAFRLRAESPLATTRRADWTCKTVLTASQRTPCGLRRSGIVWGRHGAADQIATGPG